MSSPCKGDWLTEECSVQKQSHLVAPDGGVHRGRDRLHSCHMERKRSASQEGLGLDQESWVLPFVWVSEWRCWSVPCLTKLLSPSLSPHPCPQPTLCNLRKYFSLKPEDTPHFESHDPIMTGSHSLSMLCSGVNWIISYFSVGNNTFLLWCCVTS